MNNNKEKILKIRFDTILKQDLTSIELTNLIIKKFKKEEFEFLINDKIYCIKFLTEVCLKNESDNMWVGRSCVFASILVTFLFNCQKKINFKISTPLIKNYLDIEQLHALYNYSTEKNINNKELKNYLNNSPGFSFSLIQQSPVVHENQGWLIMQIAESLDIVMDYYNYDNNFRKYKIENIEIMDKVKNF